jgi:hypothetical protein
MAAIACEQCAFLSGDVSRREEAARVAHRPVHVVKIGRSLGNDGQFVGVESDVKESGVALWIVAQRSTLQLKKEGILFALTNVLPQRCVNTGACQNPTHWHLVSATLQLL